MYRAYSAIDRIELLRIYLGVVLSGSVNRNVGLVGEWEEDAEDEWDE